jgi:hypothetical protein
MIRKTDFHSVATATPATHATHDANCSKSSNCSSSKPQELKSEAKPEPGGSLSYWWRLTLPGGVVREHLIPSGETQAGILAAHPEATGAEPFTLEHTPPDAAMTEGETAAIRDWFARIGEWSESAVCEFLRMCQRSAEARAWAISQANRG